MTSLRRRVATFFGSSSRGSDSSAPAVPGRYAPEADGQPDPGEVVWAWVPYEDDPTQGKDRPVLLLDTDGDTDGDGWVGLMMSSQDHDRDAEDEARHGRHWMDVGTGAWDSLGRPSEVRLDRLIRLRLADVRREGAALDETVFRDVAEAWRGLSR